MSDPEPTQRHEEPTHHDPGPPPADIPRRWWIYQGTGRPLHDVDLGDILPPPPPWRTFDGTSGRPLVGERQPREAGSAVPGGQLEPPAPPVDAQDAVRRLGAEPLGVRADAQEADLVNAAILLRRPLLVTGRPGTGKSTLAYRISRELGLGRVLRWPIGTRTTMRSGLYGYDAVGRVHAAAASQSADTARTGPTPEDIGDFLQLGPLGTAMLPFRLPRVLLIDEFDKSDIDLPNDLLDILEAGEFAIPELVRIRNRQPVVDILTDDPGRITTVAAGRIRCRAFPVIIITSNDEREFPPAFLRRCLQLRLPDLDAERLAAIVAAHLGEADNPRVDELIHMFREHSEREGGLATDQLLNAVYLTTTSHANTSDPEWEDLLRAIWHQLDATGPT
jgi:MoxR-like ATPase